jgi:hypothetical protein
MLFVGSVIVWSSPASAVGTALPGVPLQAWSRKLAKSKPVEKILAGRGAFKAIMVKVKLLIYVNYAQRRAYAWLALLRLN